MPYISNKLVYGVGRKGNGISKVNGKNTKEYKTWQSMLSRCYCSKYLSKHPTYIGCSVSSEWLYFPTFKEWFDSHYVEGFHLDKDLLVSGNKLYSPETCIFVPQAINKLFTDNGRARGEHPIGVSFHKQRGKFEAQLNIDETNKYLGLFDSAEDAHRAYLLAKRENVIRVANEWKPKIPSKLYNALIKRAEKLI